MVFSIVRLHKLSYSDTYRIQANEMVTKVELGEYTYDVSGLVGQTRCCKRRGTAVGHVRRVRASRCAVH